MFIYTENFTGSHKKILKYISNNPFFQQYISFGLPTPLQTAFETPARKKTPGATIRTLHALNWQKNNVKICF